MKTIEDLKQYEANHKRADDLKMFTVIVMVISVGVFSIIGKENVKPIIWYWAVGMLILVIANLILDILAKRKDNELRQ